MTVVPHSSVAAFFHEVVTEALSEAQVEATEGAEYYLVSLLGEFARARLPDEALSLKLVQPQPDPAKRVEALKQVGDTTLYITGLFAPSLHNALVDADYYINLGEAAYRELGSRLSGHSSIGEIYAELAAKFPRFVDVLNLVRQQLDLASSDVVTLYEQWLVSRSQWVEQRLRAMGVLVGGDSDQEYLQ